MSDPTPVDDRSAMAKAVGRASEASTVGFTIAICFLLGYFLDRYVGTSPLFSVIGLVIGMVTAFSQLIKLSQRIVSSESKVLDDENKTDTSNRND